MESDNENDNLLNRVNLNAPNNAPAFSEERWAEIALALGLSDRELDVIWEMFKDATDLAIAATLGISEATVRTHVRNLHIKLGIRTRSALVRRVYDTDRALSLAKAPELGIKALPRQSDPAPSQAPSGENGTAPRGTNSAGSSEPGPALSGWLPPLLLYVQLLGSN
jgi:DNA-binding CsgD family transcriptional regulator